MKTIHNTLRFIMYIIYTVYNMYAKQRSASACGNFGFLIEKKGKKRRKQRHEK